MEDMVLVEGNNTLNIALVPIVEEVGSVSGVIRDEITREYLAGVNVTVNGYNGYTDSSGYYEILNIPVGQYRITFSKVGYYPAGFNFPIVGSVRINYVLYPE